MPKKEREFAASSLPTGNQSSRDSNTGSWLGKQQKLEKDQLKTI